MASPSPTEEDMVIKRRRQTDGGFSFDKTINLGHIISIIVMLGGILSIIRKIDDMQKKVDMMWNQFAKDHGICCAVSLSVPSVSLDSIRTYK